MSETRFTPVRWTESLAIVKNTSAFASLEATMAPLALGEWVEWKAYELLRDQADNLYAALESALTLLEVVEGAGVAEFAGSLAAIPSNCRAALAKARGEEPKP